MKTSTFFAVTLFLLFTACGQQANQTINITESQEIKNAETNQKAAMNSELTDGTYTLDTARSNLSWSASRLAATPHTGTAPIKNGALILEKESAWGDFTINLAQITEAKNNERFLNHVKSADFFDVEKHPTSQFTISNAERKDDGSYEITGDLTIKDITNEITFPATITSNNGELQASAKFEINRLNWNITYDSGSIFSELGDRAIKDEIGFELNLVFLEE